MLAATGEFTLNRNDYRVGLQLVSADSSSESTRFMAAAAAPAAFFAPMPGALTAAREACDAWAGEESGDCPFRIRSCAITALASSRIFITSPSVSVPAAPPVTSATLRFNIRAELHGLSQTVVKTAPTERSAENSQASIAATYSLPFHGAPQDETAHTCTVNTAPQLTTRTYQR